VTFKRHMIVLSFGGGVQTVAVAAMACNGKLPMPDFAVFADTRWETAATYDYIAKFGAWMGDRGLKLKTVSKGDLRSDALDPTHKFVSMPLFTETDKGPASMLRRQCTNEYKVQPVIQAIRREAGLSYRQRWKGDGVSLWLGISTDEAHRAKDSRVPWISNVYPLIENGFNRQDCINYIKGVGLEVPPKSACIGCPYHSNNYWRELKKNSPQEFDDACEFDDLIRETKVSLIKKVYLHRSLRPLREADLGEDQLDLFGNECEGHCCL
jgi:hypothetical protein